MPIFCKFNDNVAAFYDTGLCQPPDGAVEISADDYHLLLSGASEGKLIVPDANGYPILSDPPPNPPLVPKKVTKFQAKAALYLAGLLDDVESLMADPATDRLTRLAWSESLHFERQSPMITSMAAILGLNSQQLDALFVSAFAIE